MMIALDAVAEQHVRLVDRADGGVDDLDLRLLVRQLAQRVGEHFGRALHVGLDDDGQFFGVAGRELLLQRFEREPSALRAERALLGLRLTELRDLPRLRRIRHRLERIARRRAAVSRPSTSTGVDGPATFTGRPRSSISARTRPTTGPAMMLSPTRSEPSCTSTVATGPRPRSSLVSSTVPIAARFGFALCSPISVTSRIISSSRSSPVFFFAETSTKTVDAAPLLGNEIEVRQLPLDRFGIRTRLVDLVDRDDDRHVGGARVIDRFLRLRHHTVVGGDDENDDVGDAAIRGRASA